MMTVPGRSINFGKLLRRYRELAGLSQCDLAKRTGIPQRKIGWLERGYPGWPSPAALSRLAQVLRLGPSQWEALVAAAIGVPGERALGLTAAAPYIAARDERRVFLCHSSSDKPTVRDLDAHLWRDGFQTWFDEEALLPGQDWDLEIRKAIRRCFGAIVCLSPSSVNKAGYVQKEIRIALDVADEQPEGAIFLIPARLELCDIPERLRRWQWVNLFEEDGYDRLKEALTLLGSRLDPIEVSPTRVLLDVSPYRIYGVVTEICSDDLGGFRLYIKADDGSYWRSVSYGAKYVSNIGDRVTFIGHASPEFGTPFANHVEKA